MSSIAGKKRKRKGSKKNAHDNVSKASARNQTEKEIENAGYLETKNIINQTVESHPNIGKPCLNHPEVLASFRCFDSELHISLGHEGDICPNRPRENFTANMIIVDLNGVHKVSIIYCHCPDRPGGVEQLRQASLWPAATATATSSPSTCFALSYLEKFHHYYTISPESALDFWKGLTHLTNKDFFETVLVKFGRYMQME